jgi:hypothetical protein
MSDILSGFDLDTLSADQLDQLSIDELLGNNIADYDISQNLPDGTYIFYIEKRDVQKKAADNSGDKVKKAQLNLVLALKVVKVIQLADPELRAEDFEGRVHFQRYNLFQDFGKRNLILTMLGLFGVSFRDKKAQAELGESLIQLLDSAIAEKVPFGAKIVNKESNGYANCDVSTKEKDFIDFEQVQQYLG